MKSQILGGLCDHLLPEDAEAKLRALENKVGIDPGGWSIAGQPLFHPTPEMLQKATVLGPKLAAAMKSDDAAQVRAVTSEMLSVLGDQAGVPDGHGVAVSGRAEVDQTARPAIEALLDEFDAMGITVEALPELLTMASLYPSDLRLQKAVNNMAAVIVAKCTDGRQVNMGAQPNQLVFIAPACSVFTKDGIPDK
jgi:hypothetical protein